MPTNPHFTTDADKWQAIYSADNAYRDEGAISSLASLLRAVCLITVLGYGIAFVFAILPVTQRLFSLDYGFVESLNNGQITESLRDAFRKQGWVLTETASLIQQPHPGNTWLLQDVNIQYIIRVRGQALTVSGKKNGIMFLLRNINIKKYLFRLDLELIESLDANLTTESLRMAFQKNDHPLGNDPIVVIEQAGGKWLVIDADRRYLIRNEQQSLMVYYQWRELTFLGAIALTVLSILVIFIWVGKIAFLPTQGFFREFYIPPDNIEAKNVITYRAGSRTKLPMPFSEWFSSLSQFKYVLVQNGEFLKKDEWTTWLACNLGGPLLLIVFDGSALYIERGNRFSRVVGPGAAYLERYETIKYAVDLRAKVKTDKIEVWTKDGIFIKLTMRVQYRIGDPQKIEPQLIYPFDPLAVKKAIERHSLRWPDPTKEPSEFTWEDAVWGQVTGIIPNYIGSRFLDDLTVADRKGGQILSANAAEEVFVELNKATTAWGVYVTDFQIISIEIPEKVKEYYLHYWEAEKQSRIAIIDGEAKAFDIRAHEKARADAQRDLIMSITAGLQDNEDDQYIEPLLLSLSGLLDSSLNDPALRANLARDTLDTLAQIQKSLDLEHPPSDNNHDNS